ncbi:MAG: copper amine oxidase N-terminal domain-containing protein [Clostridia bacterium]|nr:copper amine oxidase N-terminal domain-containing protein [Clostridia bacterium]
MKQTSKFLTVILAAVFVLQTFGLVCFAQAVSNLPTDFGWNPEKMGHYQFTVPDHFTDSRYEYGIILYKDGTQVYDTKSSVHPTVYAEERTQSMSYLLDRFAQYGSGNYTFAITVNDETTAQSEPFTYVEPEETLPVPQNVVLLDTQVRWTPVTAENCSGYFVNYYVGYPDGRVDFIYGQQQKKASSDYQDYTQDDDVPKYFHQQVDLLYQLDPVKYPKESAFLMAAVKASSGDIFTVKSSEFSVPVAMGAEPDETVVLTIGQTQANVNGETVTNDAAPIIVNDRTMLPIRFVAEQFGATVGWIGETRTVTVTLGDTLISMVIGESVATVNGEVKELDSPSFIENDRTYLPVRFVVENLGLHIDWNGETQQVTITR